MLFRSMAYTLAEAAFVSVVCVGSAAMNASARVSNVAGSLVLGGVGSAEIVGGVVTAIKFPLAVD